MNSTRVALANVRFPESAETSVRRVIEAIREAARERAEIICFPECYVPGYRALGAPVELPRADFLDWAWTAIGAAARETNVGVVLGTDRLVAGRYRIAALVIDRDGTQLGFQDKVQLDPSEDALYEPGSERRIFTIGALKFGVSICHEGFRYPETVRWAVRRGAHLVFHPHFSIFEGGFKPKRYGDSDNSFHEKSLLCRAAENTCFIATVNCATRDAPTTSAFINPDGTVLSFQPYGQEGLLIENLDLSRATGLLASRYRPLS